MRVGFIGLGKIGQPMARRLLAAGHELVVHNRSRRIVTEFARIGADPAHSPCEIAAEAELVITALPLPSSEEEVYLGPDGLCECARPNQLLISHATVYPDLSRKIARAARLRGAEFLDAPVSGGPEAAERGDLAIMVGGDRAAFKRARPVLRQLGRHVRLCGPSGAGSMVKLVNQILITIHSVAAAEALTFAERVGIDPAVAHEMIMAGLAASAVFDRNGRRISSLVTVST